ncbi:unnamed protein product [Soboliphyme baturini]|uniref:MAM domain-containing protein n=1 Tax=Soboliphyme baturini TaxID=241478 RepID=A0A183J1V3_9BILA|nr:unnamed protein product [Soboliphyme baturini]
MANALVSQLIVCSVLVHLIQSGQCCTPGKKDAVDRLRKFLGLEPVMNALYNTGFSDRYITRAQELNCDFENPRLCLWKNNELGSADQLEWYLMRKVEDKRWPHLIKPGDNPPYGNQLIISGTEVFDPEAKAVWISNPVLCQRGDGKFAFTYQQRFSFVKISRQV